jgi:hypothetical protein
MMDRSEELALVYLQSLQLGDIVFEPDGQSTPDFLIDRRIAVEVRRLNQNHETADGFEGLEGVTAALRRYVENLLPTFGPAPDGRGWWVFYDYRRPLDGKAVKQALPRVLEAFKAAPHPEGADLQLTRTFSLEIRQAGIAVEHYYMLGGYMDFDNGGFVAAEIIRNLNLVIAEKAAKVAPHRERYAEWWLVLLDHVGPDLNVDERATIGQHVDLSSFSRVVLIHPRAPTRALVLSRPDRQAAS